MVGEEIKSNSTLIKKLAINFSSLSLLQLSNYIFPLIVFPYLVRVLGPEKYGLVNFAFAFTVYFSTVIDYGFALSATREIAVEKTNSDKIKEIFNSTLFSKIILLIPSTVIYFGIVLSISLFNRDIPLYAIVYIAILGSVLFPNWFFMGIEKMQFIAIFNIIFRLLSVIAIFLLVTESDDVIIYAAINSSYQLLLGIAGLYFVIVSGYTKVVYPGIKSIIDRMKKGFSIFSSSFAIMLYTTSNTFILGLLAGNTSVGIFTGADKLRLAYQSLGNIAGQTVYPSLSSLMKNSKSVGLRFLKKYSLIFGTIILLFSSLVFSFSDLIVEIVLGSEFSSAGLVLKILAFLPFIIFLSNIVGIQIMLNLGYDKEFNRVILIAALINITLLFILVPTLAEIGTAISMLTTEVFVTTTMLIFISKRKLLNAV